MQIIKEKQCDVVLFDLKSFNMKTTNIGGVAGGFVNNGSLTLLLVLVEVLIFQFGCLNVYSYLAI